MNSLELIMKLAGAPGLPLVNIKKRAQVMRDRVSGAEALQDSAATTSDLKDLIQADDLSTPPSDRVASTILGALKRAETAGKAGVQPALSAGKVGTDIVQEARGLLRPTGVAAARNVATALSETPQALSGEASPEFIGYNVGEAVRALRSLPPRRRR